MGEEGGGMKPQSYYYDRDDYYREAYAVGDHCMVRVILSGIDWLSEEGLQRHIDQEAIKKALPYIPAGEPYVKQIQKYIDMTLAPSQSVWYVRVSVRHAH